MIRMFSFAVVVMANCLIEFRVVVSSVSWVRSWHTGSVLIAVVVFVIRHGLHTLVIDQSPVGITRVFIVSEIVVMFLSTVMMDIVAKFIRLVVFFRVDLVAEVRLMLLINIVEAFLTMSNDLKWLIGWQFIFVVCVKMSRVVGLANDRSVLVIELSLVKIGREVRIRVIVDMRVVKELVLLKVAIFRVFRLVNGLHFLVVGHIAVMFVTDSMLGLLCHSGCFVVARRRFMGYQVLVLLLLLMRHLSHNCVSRLDRVSHQVRRVMNGLSLDWMRIFVCLSFGIRVVLVVEGANRHGTGRVRLALVIFLPGPIVAVIELGGMVTIS